MMNSNETSLVTVIYYEESSLEIKHDVKRFECNQGGRVILPLEYKKGKSIIAVCEGRVKFLNKIGDRILPNDSKGTKDSLELPFH